MYVVSSRSRSRLGKAVAAACGLAALLAAAPAPALTTTAGARTPADDDRSRAGSVITLRTARVGSPGNPPVAVVPFTDAVYQSCADAPESTSDCQTLGAVAYPYEIGQLEITVGQWVAFLNTVDPDGRDRHDLYEDTESSSAWPKYGQVDFDEDAARGRHYAVGYPQWTSKPYGFANFLEAARLANSLDNGRILSKETTTEGRFTYVTYRVRLSPRTERGMYDLTERDATRTSDSGFVVPSQNEWVKAAYYDPSGVGTFSYWKYPTNPGVFGDGAATAPSPTVLDPATGDVTNAAPQPLASYHASDLPAPSWCPGQVPSGVCTTANPIGLDPATYADVYQGSLATVGQARTTSPWGTLDQGGNAVEWTDTITPPPGGTDGARVWRRLHGGVSNAPAFQMWPSAVGLQPQDNVFYSHIYPWLGIRIGVIGDPGPRS
ncbi:hypothetical protein [Streptomyces sp. FIT100]|uniref:hypothetical protein n=1 Tax=Streptomyces sp. FIT100 TaxID=2837956 RepID=UPI0021C724F6|nr:hypothetical protein [Streptomyces sp. FIT100]UUN28272.1 hypothetical protein KK483_19225 [Streptomyces sp. FIT100]